MEKSEAIPDFTPKKLARQLDFTAAATKANAVFPETVKSHVAVESQSGPKQSPAQAQAQSQSQSQSQALPSQSQHQKPVSPAQMIKSPAVPPSQKQVQSPKPVQQPWMIQRIPHPVHKIPIQTSLSV